MLISVDCDGCQLLHASGSHLLALIHFQLHHSAKFHVWIFLTRHVLHPSFTFTGQVQWYWHLHWPFHYRLPQRETSQTFRHHCALFLHSAPLSTFFSHLIFPSLFSCPPLHHVHPHVDPGCVALLLHRQQQALPGCHMVALWEPSASTQACIHAWPPPATNLWHTCL